MAHLVVLKKNLELAAVSLESQAYFVEQKESLLDTRYQHPIEKPKLRFPTRYESNHTYLDIENQYNQLEFDSDNHLE